MEKVAGSAAASVPAFYPSDAVSRRAIVAGLAISPLAALPTLAEPIAVADPVLIAIADYDAYRVQVEKMNKLIGMEIEKEQKMREEIGLVIFRGREVRGLTHLNGICKTILNKACLESTQIFTLRKTEILREYNRARLEFSAKEPAYEAAAAQCHAAELEEAVQPLDSGMYEAMDRILETAPTTAAGAIALLNFMANLYDSKDFDVRISIAIRAAARVLKAQTT